MGPGLALWDVSMETQGDLGRGGKLGRITDWDGGRIALTMAEESRLTEENIGGRE